MSTAIDYTPSPLVREALALVDSFARAEVPRFGTKGAARYLYNYLKAHERLIRRLYRERPMTQCSWCDEHFPTEMTIQPGGPDSLVWCIRCAADYCCDGWQVGAITDTERDKVFANIIEQGTFPVAAVPVWVER